MSALSRERTCKVCPTKIMSLEENYALVRELIASGTKIPESVALISFGFCSEECAQADDLARTIRARTQGVVR